MAATIIYCFDAYCSWCYGFSAVINKLHTAFSRSFDFEVLSGGMILPDKPVHIHATAAYFLETCKKVEAASGAVFGEDFLWHIKNPPESDWYPNSEKPAVALCVFKDYFPEKQVEIATALQYALYSEGRDLCDDEAYRHLLLQFNIPDQEFYDKLHSEQFKDKAYSEFALVKQLKVTGYPCLFLQISASKFYMLANGYTDYNSLVQRIHSVIAENNLLIPNL